MAYKSLALGQYRESFADAAVDGVFLLDLNDEDLGNTLGTDHALHRKKILNSVRRLAYKMCAVNYTSLIRYIMRDIMTAYVF